MNLMYGEIVDIKVQDGIQLGNVRVSGAMKKIALDLVDDVRKGDKVLLCDCVAIAKVTSLPKREGMEDVPGDSRQVG